VAPTLKLRIGTPRGQVPGGASTVITAEQNVRIWQAVCGRQAGTGLEARSLVATVSHAWPLRCGRTESACSMGLYYWLRRISETFAASQEVERSRAAG